MTTPQSLRRLTTAGIDAFTNYLDKLRDDPALPPPRHLLTETGASEPLPTKAAAESQNFTSRFEVAAYLHGLLSRSGLGDIHRDKGFWTWLSLFYFDQVCPIEKGKRTKPGDNARHVADLSKYTRFYRHLLAGPYFIYNAHADDPVRAKAVLLSRIDKPGDIVEQFASRQELVTNKTIMDVATRLYVEQSDNTIKRGAGGKTNGGARRLADVLGQFELNFDLYLINADKLLSILPAEFRRFRDY